MLTPAEVYILMHLCSVHNGLRLAMRREDFFLLDIHAQARTPGRTSRDFPAATEMSDISPNWNRPKLPIKLI